MLKRGLVKVLPTHVGMSRAAPAAAAPCVRAPHTRGDEPYLYVYRYPAF